MIPAARWAILTAIVAGSMAVTAEPARSAAIDRAVSAAWKSADLRPTERTSDEEFFRRIHLDIAGRLPTPEAIRKFTADGSPNKRAKAIDELLASPGYAEHWADYWDGLLIGRTTRSQFIDRNAFLGWLREEFAKNRPWSEMVHALVTAEGYGTKARPRGIDTDPPDLEKRYDPAANWFIRHFQSIPDLTGATSQLFLGVQIQCAQCHDHKSENWKQKDYQQFGAFFAKTWPKYYDKGFVVGLVRLDVRDQFIVAPIDHKQFGRYFDSYRGLTDVDPKTLDGKPAARFSSRRKSLADWIVAKDNPYFANAIVNRYWGRLMGHGFVEPVDDFRPSNPPEQPELLKTLATDFAAHNFDLRHLIRSICNSQAYQLSSRQVPKDKRYDTERLWARYPMKSLDIEVQLRCIFEATQSEKYMEKAAAGNFDAFRRQIIHQFVMQSGSDDMSEVTLEGTIPQALLLLNNGITHGTTRHSVGLALGAVMREASTDEARIEELYLRTLSRQPSKEETADWIAFVNAPREPVRDDRPEGATLARFAGGTTGAMMAMEEKSGGDFQAMLSKAKTAADFKLLYQKARNNADIKLLVDAIEQLKVRETFRAIDRTPGATTAKDQAFEDIFWALLNSSEFLLNH